MERYLHRQKIGAMRIEEYFAGKIGLSLWQEMEENKRLRSWICFKFWLISFYN